MNNETLARLENVTVRFGNRMALHDATFQIEAGEFVGIVGPNGAGKTTAFRVLQGLQQPTSGSAALLGEPSYPPNRRRNALVSYQPQHAALFEQLTVRENVRLFARFRNQPAQRAETVIERLELEDAADVRQEKLSGGQRQRLSVACAVVGNPRVLFLDEPTANVDPLARRSMRTYFKELSAQGMSIVFTSHDLNEVAGLCDRVIILFNGRVLVDGSPDHIRDTSGLVTLSVRTLLTLDQLAAEDSVVTLAPTNEGYKVLTRQPERITQAIVDIDAHALVERQVEPFEETYIRLVEQAGDLE
ncbi:ABC transporter ATP-binding protein [Auritidibacter sp. NML120779]|nr:ABC transporter ATP-binding protein [Auritidibacter sp. NML120779]